MLELESKTTYFNEKDSTHLVSLTLASDRLEGEKVRSEKGSIMACLTRPVFFVEGR